MAEYSWHYTSVVAENIVKAMKPYCDRIEVAGALRRECSTITSIEICALAKNEQRDVALGDLFNSSESRAVNILHADWAEKGAPYVIERINTEQTLNIKWIKRGHLEDADFEKEWPVGADDKIWRGLLPDGLKIDISLPKPETWGAILMFRTGSKFFNMAIAGYARDERRMKFEEGQLTKDGEPITTPEERIIFDVLGLQYVHPRSRVGQKALKARGQK